MEHYSAIKKLKSCYLDNMGGFRAYYAKGNIRQRKTNIGFHLMCAI